MVGDSVSVIITVEEAVRVAVLSFVSVLVASIDNDAVGVSIRVRVKVLCFVKVRSLEWVNVICRLADSVASIVRVRVAVCSTSKVCDFSTDADKVIE